MDESEKVQVSCPCCQARLTVDVKSGEVIWHEESPKEARTLADLVKGLDERKRQTAERFEREKSALKDRHRVVEEKVKEAMKRVDPDSKPPLRPIDLD